VYLNTSINQLRLTLSTCTQRCAVGSTLFSVGAINVESWNHEELRHVGSLTPIALCELMSREQVSQNHFAVAKCILPWMKTILPWWNLICRRWKWFCRDETDFAVLWNWFYRDEIDFAVAKLIFPSVKRVCRDSCGPPYLFCKPKVTFPVFLHALDAIERLFFENQCSFTSFFHQKCLCYRAAKHLVATAENSISPLFSTSVDLYVKQVTA